MLELGFGPTIPEFQDLVGEYVTTNDLKTRYKGNRPGYDWTTDFLRWHRLNIKEGGQMQLARKNVTFNPFIIYGFYELLAKEVECLGISDKPECKYIGPLGEKCIQVTHGANREKTTVLAVCCTDGTAMDPLIIFRGKNLQSTWLGNESLKDTYYAISENGRMTTKIFHHWFELFIDPCCFYLMVI